MKTTFLALIIPAAFLFFSNVAVANGTEEECEGPQCSETYINRPVGPQSPKEPIIPYDDNAANPARSSLRFPEFRPSWGLSLTAFEKARQYFEQNRTKITNPRYFAVVDFRLHSSKKRFFLFDLSNDSLELHNVSAGKNSDPDNDGYATKFSNEPGSLMSSLGFYQTLQTYNGAHGFSLQLEGLSKTNSNARSRAVVMHPADYVSDKEGRAGRSWGCTALDPIISKSVIDKLKNGGMMLVDF